MAVRWPSSRGVTWAFVALGLALRVWHYLLNHTIWYDEAVLLANILEKDYAGLLGPTKYEVAAPPVFLWLLKAIYDAFGDAPYAWRFLPFACSCGTLLLTVPLTRRLLTPAVAAVAVALTAVSDNHVWLGCTIKPYAGDAFLTTVLLYFYAATGSWSATKRLLVLAAMAPPVLCTSYPAAFVIGGVLLALVPAALRERPRGVLAWLAAGLAAVGTFAALYFGPIKAQRVEVLVNEWVRMYPNFQAPETIPWWLIDHTATVFQFCYNPVGFALVLVAPLGVYSAWRNGRRGLVVALVVPFVLAVLAAALKAYPYGFNRLMMFIAPCVLLLGALGLEAVAARLKDGRWLVALGAVLVAVGSAVPAWHLVQPWPHPDSSSAAKYIRTHRPPGEFVASDEKTYFYFFYGELQTLDQVAAAMPPGSRVWVPMDHYNPDGRRWYVTMKLEPHGLRLVEETQFFQSTVFVFEKP